jgi:membrane fusion protein (multidrug efflux system)
LSAGGQTINRFTVRSSSPLAPALALLLLLPVAGCKKADPAARTRPPPTVTVAPVDVRDVPVEVRAPVDLRPIASADVVSKTLGYLDTVLVDRGDRVRPGQLLAIVRPSDLPDQAAAARASLELAKGNLDRIQKLAPTGVVSQQELQQAEANHAAASANLASLATRLGETQITSPLEGVVAVRRLDPGALVGPTAGTGPILVVSRVDTLRAFVPVNERDVTGLRVGLEAHVELDAFPGRSFRGTVSRVSPAFDPITRTLDAEVQLKNPGELRAGMYGRGAVVVATHPKAIVVPAQAVILSGGKAWAFVVQGEKAKRVEVALGVDGGDWLEVTRGLAPGDEIVTAGSDALADGTIVRVQRGTDPFTGQRTAAAQPPPATGAPAAPAAK